MWENVRKNAGWYMAGLITLLLVVAGFLVCRFWDWLRMGTGGYESGTATVRNLGLLFTAIIALPLGIWRSFVAHRQSQTAQQGLLNERYQKGSDMLGSEFLPVRLGGIYALQRLVGEHPEQYHVQIMRLFCAFIRFPTHEAPRAAESIEGDDLTGDALFDAGFDRASIEMGENPSARVREDVQVIMDWMSKRSKKHIALEKENSFVMDLRHANLRGANLTSINLVSASLNGTDLSNTVLCEADLSNARLYETNMSGANLAKTILSSAKLYRSRDEPKGCAVGLSQEQLDQACADPNHPPKLDSLSSTKKPASRWNGAANHSATNNHSGRPDPIR